VNIRTTIEEIRALPNIDARARIAALPVWARNLSTFRALAQEIDSRTGPPAPTAPTTAPTPRPEPRGQVPTAHPEPSAGTLEIVQWCAAEKIPAELVGRWVWVRFTEKPAKEVTEKLKARGFRFVGKRQAWAHDCGHKSRRGKGDPRDKYGAIDVEEAARTLAAA